MNAKIIHEFPKHIPKNNVCIKTDNCMYTKESLINTYCGLTTIGSLFNVWCFCLENLSSHPQRDEKIIKFNVIKEKLKLKI